MLGFYMLDFITWFSYGKRFLLIVYSLVLLRFIIFIVGKNYRVQHDNDYSVLNESKVEKENKNNKQKKNSNNNENSDDGEVEIRLACTTTITDKKIKAYK